VEALAGILARLTARLGLDGELQGWRAVEQWPRIVGPRIARRTHAVGFRDGVLHVEVEGSAWMHELSFLKHELVRKIQRDLGTTRVREVRFVLPRQGGKR
jgi:predicted nucleic acid-binding Zn ribbon protein